MLESFWKAVFEHVPADAALLLGLVLAAEVAMLGMKVAFGRWVIYPTIKPALTKAANSLPERWFVLLFMSGFFLVIVRSDFSFFERSSGEAWSRYSSSKGASVDTPISIPQSTTNQPAPPLPVVKESIATTDSISPNSTVPKTPSDSTP